MRNPGTALVLAAVLLALPLAAQPEDDAEAVGAEAAGAKAETTRKAVASAEEPDARQSTKPKVTARSLIEGALDLTRGKASHIRMAMTIHRPNWERRLELEAWTRGREDALIRFTAPAKEAGNATLKKGKRMWMYSPKLKREVRLPASMMSQSWAGSDFSYNDLSRTDRYLHHYDSRITTSVQDGEHTIHTLELVPRDDAPVVWGKETMVLRDDYVVLTQTFFDQDLEPLKQMRTMEIGELGGRTIGLAMRMGEVEEPDRWTEVRYTSADFEAEIDDRRFTTFALRGRR